jgi:hypothetical protein
VGLCGEGRVREDGGEASLIRTNNERRVTIY